MITVDSYIAAQYTHSQLQKVSYVKRLLLSVLVILFIAGLHSLQSNLYAISSNFCTAAFSQSTLNSSVSLQRNLWLGDAALTIPHSSDIAFNSFKNLYCH